MVLLQDLCALFHNFSLILKLAFKISKKNQTYMYVEISRLHTGIAVYQDNGANPAIKTIPPVFSPALATNNVWLIVMREKGNVIITCSLAFNPHELLIRDGHCLMHAIQLCAF